MMNHDEWKVAKFHVNMLQKVYIPSEVNITRHLRLLLCYPNILVGDSGTTLYCLGPVWLVDRGGDNFFPSYPAFGC